MRATVVLLCVLAVIGLSAYLLTDNRRQNEDHTTLGQYRWIDRDAGVICYVMPSRSLDCLPISETQLGGAE